MATHLLDGKALAQYFYEEKLSKRIALLPRAPSLVAVLVGDSPASLSYVKGKRKVAEKIGITSMVHHLPVDTSEAELNELIGQLNSDNSVDGILLQLPLPHAIHPRRALNTVAATKDVDGLTSINLGKLVAKEEGFHACTPAGVMHLIDWAITGQMFPENRPSLAGKRAVVIGRSLLVGRPASLLLTDRDATVTVLHSQSGGVAEVCLAEAEVIVVATGVPGAVRTSKVNPEAIVIDVGISRNVTGQLVGDVVNDGVVKAVTPVPGGVGPMTIAMLMANTVTAAEKALSR